MNEHMPVPGYTQYGLAERLLIDGDLYVYEAGRDRWIRPEIVNVDNDDGYTAHTLHMMCNDFLYRVERAA